MNTVKPAVAPSFNVQDQQAAVSDFSKSLLLKGGLSGIDPGDFIRYARAAWERMSLAAPNAYDAYYLYSFKNILNPEEEKISREDTAAWIENEEGRLYEFFSRLPDVKPMVSPPSDPSDMRDCHDMYGAKDYMEKNAHYSIKQMRFECPLKGQDFQYPAERYSFDLKEGLVPENVRNEEWAAYIAFPIAQLGVMDQMAIVSESDTLESLGVSGTEELLENAMPSNVTVTWPPESILLFYDGFKSAFSEIFNPDRENSGDLQNCMVYPCFPFPRTDDRKYHLWSRMFLPKEAQWPVPGEFVSLMCKPMMFHIWWFQESNPFVYSGNWFETEFYTTGIIEAIFSQDEDGNFLIDGETVLASPGEEGQRYRIRVKGEKLIARATDFFNWSVGDRAALIKSTNSSGSAFDWDGLKTEGEKISSGVYRTQVTEKSEWIIVPVEFYQ